MPDTDQIGKLFPVGTIVRQSRYLSEHDFELRGKLPELGNVSRTRIQAFATGRTLAHQALLSLGESHFKVDVGPNGEPVWPPGFTGSISHKTGRCIAVVAPTIVASGLGVDLESNESLEADVWDCIAVESELFESVMYPQLSKGQFVNLLFSAKEAIFKCQSAITGLHDLNFKQVRVKFDRETQSFSARLDGVRKLESPSDRLNLSGKFLLAQDVIVTSAILAK